MDSSSTIPCALRQGSPNNIDWVILHEVKDRTTGLSIVPLDSRKRLLLESWVAHLQLKVVMRTGL